MNGHLLCLYGCRREHYAQFGVIIFVGGIKTGCQFRDRDLGKTGNQGDLLDLFVIILCATVNPCDTRIADGSEIFFERTVYQPVDPAILIEDYTETQRGR